MEFPGGLAVRIWHIHCGRTGSTPGQGTILCATQCGQNTRKKKERKKEKVKHESRHSLMHGFIGDSWILLSASAFKLL